MRYLENKVNAKQLEVIADFVKQIQQIDFLYIDFIDPVNSNTKPIPIGIVTLFDIAEMKGFEDYNELYFWGTDGPEEKPLHAWDFFFKFYSNPLLPPSIEKVVPKSELYSSPSFKNVVLKQSGKTVNESEVLLKGPVKGAATSKVKPE